MPPISAESDLAACREILRRGSKSFALASAVLPERVRDPSAAFYAFCRVADDAVDVSADPQASLVDLRARLDAIVAGDPRPDPVDRALARVVAVHGLPRAPLDALLEGFAWDVEGRRYETLEDLVAYAARVAAAVGVVMTQLMGPRDPRILARACDLGVAMQLSNIARDVGEDGRAGRVYLPLAWLAQEGLSPEELLAAARASSPPPRVSLAVRHVVTRLMARADELYTRADLGIPMLPRDCRAAIRAARLVYADLHRVLRRPGFDPLRTRAFVTKPRKVVLLARALGAAGWRSRRPTAGDAPPLPQVAFLVEAPR